MPRQSCDIKLLADFHGDRRRQHIETIARWFWEEWLRDAEEWTLQQTIDSITKNDCFRDKLTVTMCALDGDEIVGVIQLLADERCPGYRDVGPWLGGLYIPPGHRHRGIAYQLGYAMMKKAAMMGYDNLYAFTATLDNILRRQHFKEIDMVEYGGEPHRVYRKDLI